MTISSNDRRKRYVAVGGDTFNGPTAYDASTLVVTVTVGGVTSIVPPSAYQVLGIGRGVPTRVKFNTAPANGTVVLIRRVVDYTQTTDVTNQGAFHAETLEQQADEIVFQTQQLADAISRSIHLSDEYDGSVDLTLPPPESGKVFGWNYANNGIVNIDITNPGADMLLRTNLADPTAGASLVAFKQLGVGAVNRTALAKLREFASVKDFGAIGDGVANDTAAFVAAFAAGLKRVTIPPGVYCIYGNIAISGDTLCVEGAGRNAAVVRQMTSGGFVYGPEPGTANYSMRVLNISGLRMEAGAANCGTAITMSYTGGSGYASPGPVLEDIEIVPQGVGKYWTKGVRGTNIRDAKFSRVDMGGDVIRGQMTHGFHLDGNSDPVELWFDHCYFYVLELPILVEGTYEGVYLNHVNCTSTVRGIVYTPSSAQPVCHVADCYFNTIEIAVDLDLVSYFKVCDSYLSSSGLVSGSFTGVRVNRSTGGQINSSAISDCIFIGGNTSGADTETGVRILNGQKIRVNDCIFYQMDEAIVAAGGTGNRFFDNEYITCPVTVSAIAGRRSACEQPEVFFYAVAGASQLCAPNLDVKLTWGTVGYDMDGYWSVGNNRWTPPAGFYCITANVLFTTGIAAGDDVQLSVFKNGIQSYTTATTAAKAGFAAATICADVFLNGTDYIEIFVNIAGSVGNKTRVASPSFNYMSCKVIR